MDLSDLPNCFTRDSLPVDSEEVVTPDQIKKWEYLDSIAKGIPDKNVQGGLIIGFNCVKTLESLELIPSKNNGAYAYKTALGCCIVETSKKSKRETNCNLMTVQQAPILNYLDTLLQRRLLWKMLQLEINLWSWFLRNKHKSTGATRFRGNKNWI